MNRTLIAALVITATLAACQNREDGAHDDHSGDAQASASNNSLVAELSPTEGNSVEGVVSFTATEDGVLISAHVTGLEPGKHGFHIHETGDCSAPDGTSAGGHFNPGETPHGAPSNPADQRHVGDLGNIEADESGMAHHEATDTVISLEGPESIDGKAVIVHSGEDDLMSQPTGAAGSRLACGVIGSTG
ncbi:MAG: superoxide dismutase family protein [Rhodothermia bacterium]|nr:superoxide dismutase family protein [Rhodothermia bacterium]